MRGDEEANVWGLFVGLTNGFVFLVLGALLGRTLKRCIAEAHFVLLTIPAFAVCALLLSLYLYAFSSI